MINHEVREQPHFVLGPKGTCHGRGPCGAKRGVRLRQGYGETSPKLEERRRAPFAATREGHTVFSESIQIDRPHTSGHAEKAPAARA